MRLPESSYYYNVQSAAYKERMDHQAKATKVEVQAEKLVKDILSGARGPIWHGAFASLVRFASIWAFPLDYVNKMVNNERGLDQVKRR